MTPWTTERDALLIKCVEAKMSASEAGKLIGCTRNAAIGRAGRIGHPFKSDPAKATAKTIALAQRRADAAWPEAASDLAVELYKQGHSYPKIAAAVTASGFSASRYSVCSRLHRLGVVDRSRPPRQPPRARRVSEARRLPKTPKPQAFDMTQTARHWETRRRGECAWPVGTPDRPANQFYCCAPCEGDYCHHHLAIRHGLTPPRLSDASVGIKPKPQPQPVPTFDAFERERAA